MDTVELIKSICKERGIPISKLERDCDFSNGYVRRLKEGKVPSDRLLIIAKYLNVSLEFLTTGEESEPNVQKGGQSDWYIDPETAKIAQEVFSDPDKRVLFDAARTARPEAIRFAAQLLEQWKETNPDG